MLGFGAGNLHLLLALAAGCSVLFLANHARLLEMLTLFDFRQQPGLLALLLEALKCEFDRLAVLDPDTQHCNYHLLICFDAASGTGLYVRNQPRQELPRRPGHESATKQVGVQMEHSLSAILVTIDNHSVPALRNTMLTGQTRSGYHDMPKEGCIFHLVK